MEDVMVPALSSSSILNSKQWKMQQHDLLLTQQRKQLEQLKQEQEELKARLRHYGRASTQCVQVSPKHVTVTQAAPHQPEATLTTDSVKMKPSNVLSEMVDSSKPDVNSTIPEDVDDAKNIAMPGGNELSDISSSSGSDAISEHATQQVMNSHSGRQLSYDDRPIKPLQGRLVCYMACCFQLHNCSI